MGLLSLVRGTFKELITLMPILGLVIFFRVEILQQEIQ